MCLPDMGMFCGGMKKSGWKALANFPNGLAALSHEEHPQALLKHPTGLRVGYEAT